jgi:hypothetical protein
MSQYKCIECDYCGKWQMSMSRTYQIFRKFLEKHLGWKNMKVKNKIYDFCCKECYELWKKGDS